MDNLTFADISDPAFGSRKLNSEEIAQVIGIVASIYLVKTIGGKAYDPKRHNSYSKRYRNYSKRYNNYPEQKLIGTVASDWEIDDKPHFLDLDFVKEADNWDSWCSKATSPTPSNDLRHNCDRATSSDSKPESHSRARSTVSVSEDLSLERGYVIKTDAPTPQACDALLPCSKPSFNFWKGSVVQPNAYGSIVWDVDYVAACTIGNGAANVAEIDSCVGLSSLTESNLNGGSCYKGSKESGLAHAPATSWTSEDYYSAESEASMSDSSNDSVKDFHLLEPHLEELCHESDNDCESEKVADSA